tara:strand:- start:511 stop:3153 length:2643 start_codon:yes stop_codon:yes gene_type:complete
MVSFSLGLAGGFGKRQMENEDKAEKARIEEERLIKAAELNLNNQMIVQETASKLRTEEATAKEERQLAMFKAATGKNLSQKDPDPSPLLTQLNPGIAKVTPVNPNSGALQTDESVESRIYNKLYGDTSSVPVENPRKVQEKAINQIGSMKENWFALHTPAKIDAMKSFTGDFAQSISQYNNKETSRTAAITNLKILEETVNNRYGNSGLALLYSKGYNKISDFEAAEKSYLEVLKNYDIEAADLARTEGLTLQTFTEKYGDIYSTVEERTQRKITNEVLPFSSLDRQGEGQSSSSTNIIKFTKGLPKITSLTDDPSDTAAMINSLGGDVTQRGAAAYGNNILNGVREGLISSVQNQEQGIPIEDAYQRTIGASSEFYSNLQEHVNNGQPASSFVTMNLLGDETNNKRLQNLYQMGAVTIGNRQGHTNFLTGVRKLMSPTDYEEFRTQVKVNKVVKIAENLDPEIGLQEFVEDVKRNPNFTIAEQREALGILAKQYGTIPVFQGGENLDQPVNKTLTQTLTPKEQTKQMDGAFSTVEDEYGGAQPEYIDPVKPIPEQYNIEGLGQAGSNREETEAIQQKNRDAAIDFFANADDRAALERERTRMRYGGEEEDSPKKEEKLSGKRNVPPFYDPKPENKLSGKRNVPPFDGPRPEYNPLGSELWQRIIGTKVIETKVNELQGEGAEPEVVQSAIEKTMETFVDIKEGLKFANIWSSLYQTENNPIKYGKYLYDVARFSDGSAPEEEGIARESLAAAGAFVEDFKAIDPSLDLNKITTLLKHTAYHESNGGEFDEQMGGGPARGWWQVEPTTARDLISLTGTDGMPKQNLIGPLAERVMGYKADELRAMSDEDFAEVLKVPGVSAVFAASKYATAMLNQKQKNK